jgi:NADH-quinone oxidoreductase subunit A
MIYSPYYNVLVVFIALGAIITLISLLAIFLGPKKENLAKKEAYECGIPSVHTAQQKLSVKFYLVAILFILFDIETIFLYLWALNFQELGWFGIVEIFLFLVTLLIGYCYILQTKALDWE